MTELNEISILQWNVRNTTSATSIEHHRKSISDVFGEQQITCLEEVVEDDDKMDGFAVNHQFRDRTLAVPANVRGKVEGLKIESSLDRTSYEEIELSSGDPVMYFAASATRRVCQLASYRIPAWQEDINIAHVHLSPQVPVLNIRQRKSERDHLMDIACDKAKLGRFILVGDLNASLTSKLVRALKGLEPTNIESPTYKIQLGGITIKKLTLDFAMVSRDLEADATILDPGPSDHSPVLSRVRKKE